ncbi:MAG: alanine dehydrogenase [Methanosarcinaceae archaeon]|nr:alanine dehydrogenase [Methanosarcinaceae archaeon]
MEILWLAQKDVKCVLDMASAMDVVEKAFKQHGLKKVQMPPKTYLYFEKHNGDLRTMPAFLEEQDITGVKIVNVHPDNFGKGLPTVMAVMVLNSTSTGAPLVVMDGTYLTGIRTGAAGGVAAKYLARKDSKVVGMVGSGSQARTQLLALAQVFDIEQVKVTNRNIKGCEEFVKAMESYVKFEMLITPSVEEVCDCDILVTTTPVRSPLVRSEWIKPGTHINAIGADAMGKEELDPQILTRAKIVVDDIVQASHSGEVNMPLSTGVISSGDIYGELGEVVAGIKPGRTGKDEITVFDSTGLAIQDVATANLVYGKAVERGIGRKLNMF